MIQQILQVLQSICLRYFWLSLTGEIFVAVQLGLIFSHTENYPDEPPLLNVRRLVSQDEAHALLK